MSTDGDLVARALAAREHAYAPYSRYRVGAAVLTDDGRVFAGCNVENAVYGETVCAERVAAWNAIAAGSRRLVAVAVVTSTGGTPCGGCRQVLLELGGPDLVVLVGTLKPGARARRYTLSELLPESWDATDLRLGRDA